MRLPSPLILGGCRLVTLLKYFDECQVSSSPTIAATVHGQVSVTHSGLNKLVLYFI